MGLGGRQQPAQMCVDATLGSKPTFAAGTKLRRQIIGSVSVVFVSFLLRAVFSTMNAVANALQNDSSVCGDICASPCSNVFTQMQNWITLTPEFQLLVVLISLGPVALITLFDTGVLLLHDNKMIWRYLFFSRERAFHTRACNQETSRSQPHNVGWGDCPAARVTPRSWENNR